MHGQWSGRYSLGFSRIVLAGTFGSAGLHRHPIVQVTVACTGELIATNGYDEQRCRAVVIPGGTTHTLRPATDDVWVFSVHLWPGTRDAKAVGALVPQGGGPRAWIDAALPLAGLALTKEMDLDVAADKVLDVLRRDSPEELDVPHPHFAAATELVSSRVPGRLLLRDVARAVAVSQSSLSRLFTRETGTNFAASVRWARLIYALREFEAGRNITDAANAAGFTDSAHANRVCREMTGVTPTTLVRAVRGE